MAKPKVSAAQFDKNQLAKEAAKNINWKGAPPPPDWRSFPELAEIEFDAKCKRYRAIVEQAKELETEKKKLGVEIEVALMVVGKKSVAVGDTFAVSCNGRTAGSLSKSLLLEAGVDASIIQDCTLPGREYTYVQVKKLGEKDNE